MKSVVIVDYGMGNLKSVQRGLEKVGASVVLTSDPTVIASASRLILPGVGAFEDGMMGLENAGILSSINDFVRTGNPLLGICLGMQMLLNKSEEHGTHKGLGLISGNVQKIPESCHENITRKIPHIGWTRIEESFYQEWKGSCLEGTKKQDFFYFVHSFMAVTENKENILAQCEDEGLMISAAIKRDNITGVQFHPEKSGEAGLRVLNKFINL
jgi:imidazole glycerol-phosphate synthase subunit HisH